MVNRNNLMFSLFSVYFTTSLDTEYTFQINTRAELCAKAMLPTLSLQKNKGTVFILSAEIPLWVFLISYHFNLLCSSWFLLNSCKEWIQPTLIFKKKKKLYLVLMVFLSLKNSDLFFLKSEWSDAAAFCYYLSLGRGRWSTLNGHRDSQSWADKRRGNTYSSHSLRSKGSGMGIVENCRRRINQVG